MVLVLVLLIMLLLLLFLLLSRLLLGGGDALLVVGVVVRLAVSCKVLKWVQIRVLLVLLPGQLRTRVRTIELDDIIV